jgi:ABC-type Fe3+-siderophore transport system permease subunit
MSQKATKVGKDVASIAVGGAVAYAGFLAVLAAVILLLAEVMDWWLAALIVGLVVAIVGYMLIQRGREALKHEDLAPRQTIETLKEDAEWAKQQTS